jgi:hypothetical protein
MTTGDRTLITAGRAAQILGLADRRGVYWLVAKKLLQPFTGWALEGVDKKRQLTFRLVDVRALLIERQERTQRRPPARWKPGTQLAFYFPPATPPKVLPWLLTPRMTTVWMTLKRRLELEARAKARLDGRPVKGPVKARRSGRVA